jgi:N-acetylneuraminic acid mutarotase
MMHSSLRATALVLSSLVVVACDDTTAPTSPADDEGIGPSLAVAANSWTTRQDMPSTERYALATATVTTSGRSVLYAIGGRTATGGSLSKVQAYHVSTNSWTYPAALPLPLFETNGAGVINGKVYVSGGRFNSSDHDGLPYLHMYNPATNRWTRKQDMPYGTWGGVTGVYGGKLYVLTNCGAEYPGCANNDDSHLFRYDPAANTWTELAPPPVAHQYGTGGFIGGRFYVTGGHLVTSRQLDIYDPATNTWTTGAPLPTRRWKAAGTALQAKLYVIGGIQLNPDGTPVSVRTTSVYDPATNSWTSQAQMPTARTDVAASVVWLNGQPRLEVVGGARPGNNVQYTP